MEEYEQNVAATFDVDLYVQGDPEAHFHTRNDGPDDFQRRNVVQRRGATSVKCICLDVIHGLWGPEDPDAYATVIVLQFRFDPIRQARRIAEAQIQFRFIDSQGRHRRNPEVARISLDNSYSLVASTQKETYTHGAEGTAGGGIGPANLSGTVKWQRTIEQETTDAARVIGSIDRLGTTTGPSNAASWTLLENKSTKRGVPAAMQVAILLKRSVEDDFISTVSLSTKADLRTSIKDFLDVVSGGREKDDPILFRTTLPPKSLLKQYDTDNLGEFDVSTVQDVTVSTTWDRAVK